MRIAVTGARGRLGSVLVRELAARGETSLEWSRPDYDLDDPGAAARLMKRDRPELVIHAAAWTDVDGCARDPALAERRNGVATAELAAACRHASAGLVYVSTNEVFAGDRTDGRGYTETDPPEPANPYGTAKLMGELRAQEALGPLGALYVVRTSWLFGPPGADFPRKILAARDRLPADQPLPVVEDEVGCPTYASDLASAILDLVGRARPGLYHLANAGHASRFEWARRVLECWGREPFLRPVHASEFQRASRPPAWGVLDTSKAAAAGVVLRAWPAAFDGYAELLDPA